MVWSTAVFPVQPCSQVPRVFMYFACIKQNFSGFVLCSIKLFPTWCQLFMKKDSVAAFSLGLPECFI